MRCSLTLGALVGLALLATPTTAIIKKMTLREMMAVSHDVLDAQIVDKTTFRVEHPDYAGQVFTRVTLVGESLSTGEPVEMQAVYTGSHDPADQYGSSEMPLFQDVRLGNRIIAFIGKDETNRSGEYQIWAWNCCFRVENVLGQPVVIGKGEGFPFAQNVTLDQARTQVRAVAAELAAEQAVTPAPGN